MQQQDLGCEGVNTTALLQHQIMTHKKWVDWGLFLLLSLIWGSSFILMKVSREVLNGYQIGALRIFSAGVALLPVALLQGRQVPRNKVALVVLSGLLGNFLPAFLFALAIEKISSSLEGILNSLTPLFVIIIGVAGFGLKVERKKIMGVLLGLVGLVLLSSSSGVQGDNLGYALLILLATICYGFNVNLVTRYLKDVPPLPMAAVSLSVLAILAGIVLWQQNVVSMVQYDSGAWRSIGYACLLGVVGSALATALFYLLIKRAGGLFASLVTYGIPVVAILWGIVAGETISAVQLGCLALILAGVWVANR